MLLAEVTDLCLQETPRLLAAIDAAIASTDATALAAAAHELTGMYAVFAPNSVVSVSERLEEMGRTDDLSSIDAAYAPLQPALAAFRSSVLARKVA